MLATATFRSVAPTLEVPPLAIDQLAPSAAEKGPTGLVCGWSLDPATGTLRSQWGARESR